MKRTILACMAVGLAAMTAVPAGAQVTIDVSKITCEHWLTHKVADLDHIAIWLSGYVNGKRSNTTIDVQASRDAVSRVKDLCIKSLKTPLMQVLERELAATR
jgi:acid stress chaperone HdeB